ncbi:hypothetical protein BC829DRAFT_361716, partial [Chytridium lagenaria]
IPNIPVKPTRSGTPDFSQVIRTCVVPGVWAQTFDDGPSPASNILMDHLRQRNIRTTFFNIGVNIAAYPCVMRRKEAEGHLNCLHSWSHSAFTTLTNDQIVAEVVYNVMAMRKATGRSPRCFRPPYGDIDDRVVAVLRAMGLTIVWINFDTFDWQMAGGVPAAQVLHLSNVPSIPRYRKRSQ